MDIDFNFSTRDDCLDRMVPSDLRKLVVERDQAEEQVIKLREEAARLRAENERLITLVADIRRHVSECPDGVGRFIHERMQDFEQPPNT